MAKSRPELLDDLESHGLIVFGSVILDAKLSAPDMDHHYGKPAILIGNAGPSMWRNFKQSSEYADGKVDPMNRWTRRVIGDIIASTQLKAAFPFDMPYWPFQRLAERATGMKSSRINILIHPEYGLWQAFRALLIGDEVSKFTNDLNRLYDSAEALIHPCDTCPDQPCLSACPVEAFSDTGLNVERCFQHLRSSQEPHCMGTGCHARSACPVGRDYRYDQEQLHFHMNAYLK